MTNQSKKRKFLATTLTATMVATAVAPVAGFAAEPEAAPFPDVPADHAYAGAITDMVNAGVINGLPNGDFDFFGHINRAQAAQMIAGMLNLNTGVADNTTDFVDVLSGQWYTGAVNSLVAEGIIAGKTATSFDPLAKITRAELVQLLVVAYGLENTNVDDVVLPFTDVAEGKWYVKQIKTLYKEGLISGISETVFAPENNMRRGDFAWLTANTDYKHGEKLPKPEAVAPEAVVESVKAINATTVEVKFSQAVDKTAAELKANFKIGGLSPALDTDVVLSEDGKTATLTFAASVEGENLAVVVEPIITKADDNVKTERYAEVMTYKDTVAATVTKIESATGGDQATTAKITFSEPIASIGAIKVNGVALTAGTEFTAIAGGETELNLTGLNLDATKEHTIEIVNLKDQATTANVSSLITKKFNVTVDKVAPTVTSVDAKSDTALVFTFSKKVVLDGETATDSIKLFDADLADKSSLLSTNTFSEVAGSNGTKFEVAITTPFVGSVKTADLTVQIMDKVIVDALGNKLVKDTKNVTVKKDDAAPVLQNANFRKDVDGKVKELVFTFDEDVTLTTQSVLTDLLADKSVNTENSVSADLKTVFGGTLPAGTFAVKNNVITFALTTAQNVAGKYSLEVAATKVKDKSLAKNDNIAHAFTLDFGANKQDETFKVSSANAASNEITVNFGTTAVKGGAGAGSATLLSAYTLNGKALPTGTTITLDEDQKIATIILPEGTIKSTDTAAIFVADSIVSKDGKKNLEKYTGTIAIDDNVAPELTGAVLTADNDLVISFSEAVTGQVIGDFDLVINGVTSDQTFTLASGAGSDTGKFVVNLSSIIKDEVADTVLEVLANKSENIVLVTGQTGAAVELSKNSAVTSIKLVVKDGTRTTKDAKNNTLKPGTEIKVK